MRREVSVLAEATSGEGRVTTKGSLSSDVFERRTSTGSEPFSLLASLYATVFVLPSVLILKGTICPKLCSKSRLKCAKTPFPVDLSRSKTSLLKLPKDLTETGNRARKVFVTQGRKIGIPLETFSFVISANNAARIESVHSVIKIL